MNKDDYTSKPEVIECVEDVPNATIKNLSNNKGEE